jgi:hypothetical protein
MRRSGDVEGVRQSSGDWQRGSNISWCKHTLVRNLDTAMLRNMRQRLWVVVEWYYSDSHLLLCILTLWLIDQINIPQNTVCIITEVVIQLYCRMALGSLELDTYRREQRRRPVAEVQPVSSSQGVSTRRQHRRGSQRTQHSYRTRATRGDQHLASEFEASHTVMSSVCCICCSVHIIYSCASVCDVGRTLKTWTWAPVSRQLVKRMILQLIQRTWPAQVILAPVTLRAQNTQTGLQMQVWTWSLQNAAREDLLPNNHHRGIQGGVWLAWSRARRWGLNVVCCWCRIAVHYSMLQLNVNVLLLWR